MKFALSLRPVLKGIVSFCAAAAACMALLTAVIAAVPQSAILDNSRAAADYLSRRDGFPWLMDGVEGSRMDNYADTALLDVIFCADSAAPFRSAIAAPYYRNEGSDIREDFQAVVNGTAPNSEYARYWHGSQVLLRPLLTVTSIEGCRTVLFCLALALNAVLAVLLIRAQAWLPLVGYFLSLTCVHFYTAACTLEYVMVLLVMSAASVAVAALQGRGDGWMPLICILSGVATCFMDFLTAETLTFTVPVVLYLMLHRGETLSLRRRATQLIQWGVAWLGSYAAMFALKWVLVRALCGEAVFRGIFESAALRIDGQTLLADGTVAAVTPLTALARNVACLVPFVSDSASVVSVLLWAAVALLVIFAALYLFRGEKLDAPYLLALLAVGLLPYVRYLLIYSHAHVHYFFTFRAQMALILALFAIAAHVLQDSPLWRKKPAPKKGGRR